MIFRFQGQLEHGKIEFTCDCGTFNQVEIRESSTDKQLKFQCRQCGNEIIVWQQRTHWHLDC